MLALPTQVSHRPRTHNPWEELEPQVTKSRAGYTPVFRLTPSLLVLSVDVSLGATGGEEEDVVMFVRGDSAGEDEGMSLCIGGDEVGNSLDVIQAEDPGSVTPATKLLLLEDDTVFLIPLDGVGDLVEAHTRKIKFFQVSMMNIHYGPRHNNLYR